MALDEDLLGLALFLGAGLALGLLGRFVLPRVRRRAAGDRASWAADHGWRLEPDPAAWLARHGRTGALRLGAKGRALAVLTGPASVLVDWEGLVGSGESYARDQADQPVQLTAALGERPRPGPDVVAEPRGLAMRWLEAMGLPSASTGDAAFDAAYHVRGDPSALTPALRALLLEQGYALHLEGAIVSISRRGLAPNRELGQLAAALAGVRAAL